LALVALDRLEEAIQQCDRCLSFDGLNQSAQKLRNQASEALAAKNRKEAERMHAQRQEKKSKQLLNSALRVSRRIPPVH
jgi:small subunit ribosomal protein S7e